MANRNVAITKPTTEWKTRFHFNRYKLGKSIVRFYFLPTVEYIHSHGDDYHSMVVYDSWKVLFKFLFFGIGICVTRDIY